MQLLHGSPGVDLMEPVVDFIYKNHSHFTGGIYWIPCHTPQSTMAYKVCLSTVDLCSY